MASPLLIYLVLAAAGGDIELLSYPCGGSGFTAILPTSELVCWKREGDQLVIPSLNLITPMSATDVLVVQCPSPSGPLAGSPRLPRLLPAPSAGESIPADLLEAPLLRACKLLQQEAPQEPADPPADRLLG